jgi:hypothetical protein
MLVQHLLNNVCFSVIISVLLISDYAYKKWITFKKCVCFMCLLLDESSKGWEFKVTRCLHCSELFLKPKKLGKVIKIQKTHHLPLLITYLLRWSYRSIVIHDLPQASPKAGSFTGYRLVISNTKCNTVSINSSSPLTLLISNITRKKILIKKSNK